MNRHVEGVRDMLSTNTTDIWGGARASFTTYVKQWEDKKKSERHDRVQAEW